MWNEKTIESLRRKLLNWYHLHRRKLPWRDSISPYRIWISEIMLQQTQTKTVLPYYKRFLRRFPDVKSLAKASEEEILEFWSGLGYYSRARNLQRAAAQILEKHGSFPEEFSDILALPGIGRYTAGAICSIAFNQPYPIVDGNIRRVLTRLNGITNHIAETYFWNLMSSWVPITEPSGFNQAMMELGALVCTPNQPSCPRCPLRGFCQARKLGMETSIPIIRKQPNCRRLKLVFLVVEQNGAILLAAAGRKDLIPGAWGIPWRSVEDGELPEEIALKMCRRIIGSAVRLQPCTQVRHSISRNQIVGLTFYGQLEKLGRCGGKTDVSRRLSENSFRWVKRNSVKGFLTSSLYFKILGQTEKRGQATRIRNSSQLRNHVACP